MSQSIIYVFDSIMGSGKTETAIKMINESNSNSNEKFLYITPYLDEVQRIINSCPDRNFKEPQSRGSKSCDIKRLLIQGENIVSTHALFGRFDNEITDLLMENEYTLYMDEVADVVKILDVSPWDAETLMKKYVKQDERGILHWEVKDYEGVFEEKKQVIDTGNISVYGGKTFIYSFPISIFKAFKDVYILTYMFNAQIQKYYYDYHKLEYQYLPCIPRKWNAKELITIVDHRKLNQIGNISTALSVSWFENHSKESNAQELIRLKNNCYNYFKNISQTKSPYNLWTTFKTYQPLISGKGYSKGFVPLNMRATNIYRDKTAVAYVANRFLNPIIKQFLHHYGCRPDEDAYALSEMLQFIWRSAIRDGKEITLYIPSKRMRDLLLNWMEAEGK